MPNCLIIDDFKPDRIMARVLLKDIGFEIIEAESLKKAKEAALAQKFDVVSVDWRLKDGTGIEFMDFLHLEHKNSKIKHLPYLIIASAYAIPEDVNSAIKKGANLYIEKPYRKDILKNALEFLL